MAFEDVYASVTSTIDVAGTVDEVSEQYAEVLSHLLPSGRIWRWAEDSNAYRLLRALGYSLSRVALRGRDLLREFDPTTMRELVDDWERVLGLPGDNPSPPTTLAGRRAAIRGRLLGNGDPTVSYFEDIVSAAGYPDAVVSHKAYRPFVAGSSAIDPVASGWQYYWEVTAERGDDDDLLEWAVERYAPNHTVGKVFWLVGNVVARAFDNPGIVNFRAVAYNGTNLWVAVGSYGAIQTSSDGITWSKRTSPTVYNFNAVAYDTANGLWCAVGNHGLIQTSSDGITWTARIPGGSFTGNFNAVAHDQVGLWVAVGASGEIQTSPDGITWTHRAHGGASPVPVWNGVAYSSDRSVWVTVGGESGAPYGGRINASTDAGVTWVDVDPGGTADDQFRAVSYANGGFMAVGGDLQIQTSGTGLDWRQRAPNSDASSSLDLGDAVWVGDRWVLRGTTGGEMHESWFGLDWKRHVPSMTTYSAMAYGDGIIVLVGSSGDVATAEV
jgi:uncharacterized protein YmfQ (DUF2313 family)